MNVCFYFCIMVTQIFHLLSDSNQHQQTSAAAAAAVLSVGRRGWWEVWGPVRKHVALVWSHSSSLFGLSCIRAPLLPRFTRGNTTAQNAFPPSCCSVLSVFRWVFPANQEPTKSTFNKHCHTNLHLPVCFSTALVAMAAELIQEDLTLTRRVGEKVSFSCGNTHQCDKSYDMRWYQKKNTDTFRVILRSSWNDCKVNRYGHPQKDDFSAVNKQNGCELQIQKVKLDHSATYYCNCWKDVPHSDKWCLQPVQKPPDEQMSNSVCDRKRAVNHSPGSHISPPSQPESQTHWTEGLIFFPAVRIDFIWYWLIFWSDIPAALLLFHTVRTN